MGFRERLWQWLAVVEFVRVPASVVALAEDGLEVQHYAFVARQERNHDAGKALGKWDWVELELCAIRAAAGRHEVVPFIRFGQILPRHRKHVRAIEEQVDLHQIHFAGEDLLLLDLVLPPGLPGGLVGRAQQLDDSDDLIFLAGPQNLDEDLMGLNRVSRSPHNDGLIMLLIRRCSHRVDGLGLTDDE